MVSLSANFFVVLFALTGGLGAYLNARKARLPIGPALQKAGWMTGALAELNLLWALALNALHLRWNSISGYGLGLAIGFAGLMIFLAFKSFQNGRRHWR